MISPHSILVRLLRTSCSLGSQYQCLASCPSRRRGRRPLSSARRGSRLPDLEESEQEFAAPVGLCPSAAYELHVSRGAIARDPRQQAILPALDRIFHAVTASTERSLAPRPSPAPQPVSSSRGGMSMMWSLFGRMHQAPPEAPARPHALLEPGTQGVYLWGGTGTGKTWLMDLLFHAGAG